VNGADHTLIATFTIPESKSPRNRLREKSVAAGVDKLVRFIDANAGSGTSPQVALYRLAKNTPSQSVAPTPAGSTNHNLQPLSDREKKNLPSSPIGTALAPPVQPAIHVTPEFATLTTHSLSLPPLARATAPTTMAPNSSSTDVNVSSKELGNAANRIARDVHANRTRFQGLLDALPSYQRNSVNNKIAQLGRFPSVLIMRWTG